MESGERTIENQRAAIKFNKEIVTSSTEATMEADVNIGRTGARAGQTFTEQSHAAGTDSHLLSQESFSSFNESSAKQPTDEYGFENMLPPSL